MFNVAEGGLDSLCKVNGEFVCLDAAGNPSLGWGLSQTLRAEAQGGAKKKLT
jgi:hypothetical protein